MKYFFYLLSATGFALFAIILSWDEFDPFLFFPLAMASGFLMYQFLREKKPATDIVLEISGVTWNEEDLSRFEECG